MLDRIKELFAAEGITQVGMIDIGECEVLMPRLMPDFAKSAILFSVPYRCSKAPGKDGFSEYSRTYDYHALFRSLYEKILPAMRSETGFSFEGFCDHSPINEKLAAAKCGLGIIGRNSLFIDLHYGSFVFLASLLTDAPCTLPPHEIRLCENCGKCAAACPGNAIGAHGIDCAKCLSAISQKKNKTEEEKKKLRELGMVWGCDICQNVCPHNIAAPISPLPYFRDSRIENITYEFVRDLSDEDFLRYPFSYKGRKIVLNNIQFI